jgi:hypothetical protein
MVSQLFRFLFDNARRFKYYTNVVICVMNRPMNAFSCQVAIFQRQKLYAH